jgi:TfoX/Sxy family transcriptional regulator of competence genes
MATRIEIVEYICDQISEIGAVRYKKMFGEYLVYFNEKPIFLICDGTLFVKILDTTTNILGKKSCQGYPYEGAKVHYVVEDIDNKNLMEKLALELEKVTPLPSPKKKKV